MFKVIKNLFIQWQVKRIVTQQNTVSQIAFEYNNGDYYEMISGDGSDRITDLIGVHIDQMIHQGRDKIMVVVIHTISEGGYVLGMKSDRSHCDKWFLPGKYEFVDAFEEVHKWCERGLSG